MKFLVLSVVLLSVLYTAQGAKTVEECVAAAKRCKQFIAPIARSAGGSKEGLIRALRTTPLDDICRAAKAFANCGNGVMDDPDCNVHETISKYQPLRERVNKGIKFICDDNKDSFAEAIPCLTTRQFFHKIAQCKRANPCNSDGSWNCAGNAVRSMCSASTYNFFDANWRKIQANHPGCGEDSLMKKLYAAMRN